jgi:hypothetical protein
MCAPLRNKIEKYVYGPSIIYQETILQKKTIKLPDENKRVKTLEFGYCLTFRLSLSPKPKEIETFHRHTFQKVSSNQFKETASELDEN